jgi:hypothetical protein
MTMPDTPVSSSSENVYIIVHTKDHGRYESDAMPMTYQEALTMVGNIASDETVFLMIPVKGVKGRTTTIPSEILKTSIIQVFQTPDNR